MAEAKGITTGWTKLDEWSDEIAEVINEKRDEATRRAFNSAASGVEAAASGVGGGGGGGGGGGALEEVTGAVNGVPATLQVMTDGEGWTEI